MAIPYGSKLFESTSWTSANVTANAVGSTVAAGTLIVLYLGGTRSGSLLDVSSIVDTRGNTYQWKTLPSSIGFAGVGWTRINATMSSSAYIQVGWNGTPSKVWVSAHTFTNASPTAFDQKTGSGTSSTASVTLSVSGSDWLTCATIATPYDYGVTITPVGSALSRDDNAAASSAPWNEGFSRNGTTGSTHTIGGTFVTSLAWRIAGVSFPYAAAPASTTGIISGLIGP
jgi:hypothetical protein